MHCRPRRCLFLTTVAITLFLFWRVSQNQDDELPSRSGLRRQSMAESHRDILKEHRSKTANDSWVRMLLHPFLEERRAASAYSDPVSWSVSKSWARGRHLHPLFDPNIIRILRRLASARVLKAEPFSRGSQLKVLLTLEGGQRAVLKPKRYDSDFVLIGTPYVGKDRHWAEIGGFHLSRLLLFARTTLVTGRRFHVERELLPVMDKTLNATVFWTRGRPCFFGVCHYCTGPEYGVCADDNGLLDGALMPLLQDVTLVPYAHPWRRTYREGALAEWQKRPRRFCSRLLDQYPQFASGSLLLDLIDACIHDFLIGNADRHRYETLGRSASAPVLLMDNGKGFGNPYLDETSILAPLRQCCRIRRSTWKRLQDLTGGSLSTAMKRLLSIDPLSPVLTKLHLDAMDRRLRLVLISVYHCIERVGHQSVILQDAPS